MIALVDCNNFYASCEELFNPMLKKKPLVILSNNDGCVVARSKKAKQLGVQMGVAAFTLKDQIQAGQIQALSSNFSLYADMSRRVMQTLETECDEMEVYSIDEAFLKAPDQNIVKWANDLQQKVLKWTGITVSFGVAKTKTLAKLANEIAKKQESACILEDMDQIFQILQNTALQDIWGIGSRLALKLKKNGVYTAFQFCTKSESFIRQHLGVNGWKIALELQGIRCFSLEEEVEPKQSITSSRSFGRKIEDCDLLEEAISSFASRVAEKLRAQKSQARYLTAFLTSGYPPISDCRHFCLPVATNHTPDLIYWAKRAVKAMYKPGIEYKKGGVIVADFLDETVEESDLFHLDEKKDKKRKAMQALDQINKTYGKSSVWFLSEGIQKSWKGLRVNQTPHFTTSWSDLLVVK